MNTQTESQKHTTISEGGNSCSLKGAVLFSYGVKGALPLLHAGPGCSFTAYYGHLLHSGDVHPFANSAICSNEVIFGGEKVLHKAITAAADVHRPAVIVTIPGCQPLTIGDDMEEVVRSAADQVKPTELLLAGSGGYEGDLFDGFVETGLSFINQYCESQPIEKKRVNIIGFPANVSVYWKGDLVEVKDLLTGLGLTVGCVLPGEVDLDTIRMIPAAELNLVVDEQLGIRMARHLEDKFGTPYLVPEYGSLIGTDTTMRFMCDIIDRLNLDTALVKQLEEKRNRALQMASQGFPIWSEILQHAFNTFCISAPASMAVGLTRTLMDEIGLEPKLINMNARFKGAREQLVDLLSANPNGYDPIILENADAHEVMTMLDDQWPSIILGKGTSLKSEAFLNDTRVYMSVAYPALDRLMVYNRPVMGFSGVPALLDDILNRAAFYF